MVLAVGGFWLRESSIANRCLCRGFRKADVKAVEDLVKNIFGGFLEGKYWRWKYLENPHFDSRLVAVAEINGEIVGCNHWLMRDLKYSSSIVGKAVLAADVAVKPPYRGRGIGSQLLHFLRSSEIVKNRDAALIYMFADPELAKKFHTPAAGYIQVPDGTAQYTKVLSWIKVKQNVGLLNEEIKSRRFKGKLPKGDLKVLFKMSTAPPLCIHVKDGGLAVEDDGNLDDADIVVSGDFSVFNEVKMSKRRKWGFLKALLAGRLKIRVKVTKLFRLFGVLWVFEEVFGEKMT